MGRSMLIICMGMVIVLGIVQWATSSRHIGLTDTNIGYFDRSFGQNLAGSGVEYGIGLLMRKEVEPCESGDILDANGVTVLTIQGYEVIIRIENEECNDELASNDVLVTSIANMGSRENRAEALLTDDHIYPPIPGALGFYSPSSQLHIGGNAKLFGQDTNPDGTSGPDNTKPAIASVSDEDNLVTRTGGGQYDSVTEDPDISGDPDFDHNPSLEDEQEELDEYIAMFRENADHFTSSGDYTNLGIPDDPRITVVDSEEKFTDEGGAGILLIEAGHELELRGDFNYEGLVIVQGALNIRGTVNVYGSILFGDESEVDIDEGEDAEGDFSGDATIRYSSSALANLNTHFGDRMDAGLRLVSIYD